MNPTPLKRAVLDLHRKSGEVFLSCKGTGMPKQKIFTKEFETQAVRLAQTSGRSQREIAQDLGVGLSTLVRWIGRRRDQTMDAPTGPKTTEDMVAELKRLRRENEILRQEREILKRAAIFFATEGSR